MKIQRKLEDIEKMGQGGRRRAATGMTATERSRNNRYWSDIVSYLGTVEVICHLSKIIGYFCVVQLD